MPTSRPNSYTISHRTQYLAVNAAVLTASIIQLVRHKPLIVVIVAALTFAIVGNGTIYLAGTSVRKERRRRKQEYWSQ